jgi:hypothetical protein
MNPLLRGRSPPLLNMTRYLTCTCIKWSQDVSGLKTVASHDAFLHQLKLKSVVS